MLCFPNVVVRLLFVACLLSAWEQQSLAQETNDKSANGRSEPSAGSAEYYELRIYRISDLEKQNLASRYLSESLLPALNRAKLDRVGVFTNKGDVNDHSMYVLIPFPSLASFGGLDKTLAGDREYQASAKNYFDRPLKSPVFDRIESRLMRAFAGMPRMELSKESKNGDERIFELRLYESHTEDHAARKVEMFNQGEIQIMREAGLGPVFFGQTLIGNDAPNLIYMLSAANEDEHRQHWKKFLAHPEWKRISKLDRYRDTVSKIRKWMLTPTAFSQF